VPRDYKHRAQRRPPKKPLPGWLWLLTGLLLGGFIVGLVWLRGESLESGGEWVGAKPERPPQGRPAPAKTVEVRPPPAPRFDFYNDLPNQEILVPDEELDREPPATAPGVTPAVERYLLQAGSFRRAADADRLKAQLALLGFEARVESARLDAGDLRYRVRMGPYEGREAVNRARRRLAENGHQVIAIRVRPDA
jgi:cell division protein FtsN